MTFVLAAEEKALPLVVFGCVLEDSAVLDDFSDPGYGPDGFHTQRYGARLATYGSRVLVANNVLPRSRKNFTYSQKMSPHLPTRGGDRVLYDYGTTSEQVAHVKVARANNSADTCAAYRRDFFDVVQAREVTALCKTGAEREQDLGRIDLAVEDINGAIAKSCGG